MDFSNRRKKGPDADEEEASDRYRMLFRLQLIMAAGCLLIYFYSLQFWHSGVVLRITGVGTLIGGASLLTGCLSGFIFGIPRNRNEEEPKEAEKGRDPSPNENPVEPNSNLVEISDWLTKIMVGVGLVELNSIPTRLRQLCTFLGPGLRPADCSGLTACVDAVRSSEAAAIAIVIFYFSSGFLFGYVWTRLYFEGDIARLARQNHRLKVERRGIVLALEADGLRHEGKIDEALKKVDEALRKDSSIPLALFTKGRVLKRLAMEKKDGDVSKALLSEALMYVSQAADLMPGKGEPLYNMACYQALLGLGKDKVLSTLRRAIELNPALRDIAKRDEDLEIFWEDADFKELTSSSERREG